MADQSVATEQLLQQYDMTKAQYREMESAYKRQVEQLLSNPEISSKKRELRNTRAACSELSDERDALLDRILELERAARPHDRSLKAWTGTHKEAQLRAHLEPIFNEELALDSNPHSTSRHCGPAAVQAFHQRSIQRDMMQQEQAFPVKGEGNNGDRDIIKLPKRSRTSKAAGTAGTTGGVSHQTQTQAHELAASGTGTGPATSLLHESSVSGISDPSSGIRQQQQLDVPTGSKSQTSTTKSPARTRVKSTGRGNKSGAAVDLGMAKTDAEEGHPSGDVAASMPRDMPE